MGTGRELPALLDAGYAPTGVDVAQAMLDRCARRARPVPLVRADFWGPLPLPDGSFEAAIALHGTLAHAPDDVALGNLGTELARVVLPGGVLVAEAPTPAWIDCLGQLPAAPDRVLRRTGPLTCVFEDRVAGASITARALDEATWHRVLGKAWQTRLSPLASSNGLEWLVIATRMDV